MRLYKKTLLDTLLSACSHLNHADPKLSAENKEKIVARIAELYADIRNMYQSEAQAKRQRRGSVNSKTAKENVSQLPYI